MCLVLLKSALTVAKFSCELVLKCTVRFTDAKDANILKNPYRKCIKFLNEISNHVPVCFDIYLSSIYILI